MNANGGDGGDEDLEDNNREERFEDENLNKFDIKNLNFKLSGGSASRRKRKKKEGMSN